MRVWECSTFTVAFLAAVLCAAGFATASVDECTERHRRELKAYAARMIPRHGKAALHDLRTAGRSERRLREENKKPLWPGIIYDSSRWLDKSKEERKALRQRERARLGIGVPNPRSPPCLDAQKLNEMFPKEHERKCATVTRCMMDIV
jgi:hypothetical protein